MEMRRAVRLSTGGPICQGRGADQAGVPNGLCNTADGM